ncbi:AraC family transcriptional regulator [Allokutzneria sp. A3M-2-11 16]|uniref:AraC family transcriptional regulator n=1 Tax=Allokutzneria sp. A3M-2-11 16 TaxID=2962043 RepID=UPI0020B8FA91|nr:AraC family transcriptional regulator [Allokutzneria sp. A3M-2-11 16]MCP3802228.1 AraC family transcriptional regulator [Allokutzneria sp. A3M-2-11 16]
MTHLNSPPTFWRCEPSWSWHSRPLGDHLLWCVLDGRGHMSLDDRRRELEPGFCAVFRPGDAPIAGHNPRRRLLVFGMHFDTAEDITTEPRWAQLGDLSLLTSLARLADRSFQRGDELGVRQTLLCLEQLIALLHAELTAPPRRKVDRALDEITETIRQDPRRRWSVTELAARAALSRAQFTRRFIAHTGLTPTRFQITARIERAHHLLSETGMSVTQVAAALGYADLAYFSRQYRQHTGHPPTWSAGTSGVHAPQPTGPAPSAAPG